MYTIFTDTSANLESHLVKENGIHIVPFSYYKDGNEHICLDMDTFDSTGFYNAMRSGTRVTTSQVTPQRYIDYFTPVLEQGSDILFVGMSSGISGSFQSAQLAARSLKPDFPERKILLVDSLGASLGEGLLVLKATELKQAGISIEENARELSQIRTSICQVFTVDDLKYLTTSGRLSNSVALIATALNIKPILKGNTQGKIVSFAKVHGRAKAIIALAKHYADNVINAADQTIGIAHADCPKDAETLKNYIMQKAAPKQIMTVCYEPATGSHVGPGTLALFFMGKSTFRGN